MENEKELIYNELFSIIYHQIVIGQNKLCPSDCNFITKAIIASILNSVIIEVNL